MTKGNGTGKKKNQKKRTQKGLDDVRYSIPQRWGPGQLPGRYNAQGPLLISSPVFHPKTEEPWPDRLVRGPLSLPLLRILRTPDSRLQTPSCAPKSVRPRHRLLPAIARLEKAGPFPLSWEEKEGGMTMMNLSTVIIFLCSPLLFDP